MQDLNLLVALAEIAGIFVGFGALISVTRGNAVESSAFQLVLSVVTIGLELIVAALVPVALTRFGVSGHGLWLVSGLVFLMVDWVFILRLFRRSKDRKPILAYARDQWAFFGFFWLFLEIPLQVGLFLVVLGVYPDLEPALYTTGLVLLVFQAALVLVQLVWTRPERAAPDAGAG